MINILFFKFSDYYYFTIILSVNYLIVINMNLSIYLLSK